MGRFFISVVIATKNEEGCIERCLMSVMQQTYPREKIEVIIVDCHSQDKTRERAAMYTRNIYDLANEVNLDKIRNPRGAQLNFGVQKSKGEVIFFPDADMTFDPDLFTDASSKLKMFRALYIPEIINGKGLLGQIRNFERSFYNGTCLDAPRFVWKEIFLEVKGFDQKNIVFGPDDWDFSKKLKKMKIKIGITERPLYHHEEWMTWKTYLLKKSYYTGTFKKYIEKWGTHDKDIKKQFGFYYRFLGVFIENSRWKKFVAHPILGLGTLFLKFLVGIHWFQKKRSI